MKWPPFRLSKSFAVIEEEFLEEARKQEVLEEARRKEVLREAQRKPEVKSSLGTSSLNE
jgi:hypothetical protein